MIAQRRSFKTTRQVLKENIHKLEVALARIKGEPAPVLDVIVGAEADDLPGAIERLDRVLRSHGVPVEASLRAWNTQMAAVTINTNLAIVRVNTRRRRRITR